MNDEIEAWKNYLYPGTDVLRNKLNIRDWATLHQLELNNAAAVELCITTGEYSLEGGTVKERLCNAHHQLFCDLYDWAGEFRKVNISKGGHNFGDYNSMGMYLRQADRTIREFDWGGATFAEKVNHLAKLHTELNFAHPFREGNGRATKVFMIDLARQHGVGLAFANVDADWWNQSSRDTFMDPDGLQQDHKPLLDVYQVVAIPLADHDSEHNPMVEGED